MSILFSIIIPVYNVDQYLSKCLDSIINQSYQSLEIILVDDGSTDSSASICDRYALNDKRVKVIHQSNSGVSMARNAGLKVVSGDYISFVDPDDWVESNMYQTLANYLKNRDIDIVRFNAYRKDNVLNPLPFIGNYSGKKLEEDITLSLIGAKDFGGMFILGVLWLHVFKREIIEKHHIRFKKELRRCEDRLFTISAILYSQNMMFVNDVLYHYQVYNESLSNKYDSERWQQEQIYLDYVQKEYTKCKNSIFITEANRRLDNDYLLRIITSINNEFFSDNNNKFRQRYFNTRNIINIKKISELFEKQTTLTKINTKQKLTLQLIKYNQPFLLSLMNTILLYKHKINY